MTAFSLRLTNGANAVSHLHAQTANATWQSVMDRPILGITNGIHVPSWVGRPIRALYYEHGADLDDLDAEVRARRFWDRVDQIATGRSGRHTRTRSWSWRTSPGGGC